jgi:hypothetical protein
MAPRNSDRRPAGALEDVPLDPDWPDIDAAEHRFRVDHGILRHVGQKMAADAPEYREGPGGSKAADKARSLGPAWGGWEAAAPLQAAAEQAMQHVAEIYERLVRDYETAAQLMLQTAQNYADADITTQLAKLLDGAQSDGRW